MATRFQSLKLKNPKLFGVQLSGTVGRGDKKPLTELADKCLAKGKVNLILDLTPLRTIGGGGAAILADFQKRLANSQGEAVFVGAGEVVRHFLDQKFGDLPQRHFADVEEAAAALSDSPADEEDSESEPEPEAESESKSADDMDVVGAVGFFEEEEETPEVEELIEEFSEPRQASGRRKDHKYTSLAEAVQALGSLTDGGGEDFAEALSNLLFSQGLAEDVTLMVAEDGSLRNADDTAAMDEDGALARQFIQMDRPLTLLDLQDDELAEDEVTLLARLNPDMILPVQKDGELLAAILLRRGGEDREYTVAENFAFELLITVLAGAGETPDEPGEQEIQSAAETCSRNLADEEAEWGLAMPQDKAVTEVLLRLVMDLPQADDDMHFWRIFARHAWSVLSLTELAYLDPERARPQPILGQRDRWIGLDLGNDRLQQFFRTIERPMQVKNFPKFFQSIKDKMAAQGVIWVVSLKWEGEYLGAVLLDGHEDPGGGEVATQLEDLFSHTARMFSQFGENKDDADVHLDLVRILTAQRELRCSGNDDVTTALVEQVNLLAKEMGFPPDQKRNLLYGCLLRDVGLVAQPDALRGPLSDLNPDQLEAYHNHPHVGVELLSGLKLPAMIKDVVRCHHEQFNGKGFPEGLSGREIPLAARVVTVVENYVKLIIGAEGRPQLFAKEAGRALRMNKEGIYDPDLVVVFLSAIQSARQESGSATRDKVTVA